MRLLVNTPYYQVQAIRRAYRDHGTPTVAKPSVYPLIVNFVTAAAGEVARATLTIDQDSDFLWCSTYHYFQNFAFNPALGSVAANNESGQFLDIQGGFLVDMRIERSGKRVPHDADFAFDLFSSGFYAAVAGLAGIAEDESELQVAGAIGGSDINNVISLYPSANPEPVIFPASTQLTVIIRRRIANAFRPFNGHVFMFSGVRLYPLGR